MAKPTATQLHEILREHLPYELDMLQFTFERLLWNDIVQDDLRNALIESFCIHARSLIDFFNNKQGVWASEFVDSTYVSFRGGKVKRTLIAKLNTQIAHVTLERTADPHKKIGAVERQELFDKIRLALAEFEQHLKPEFKGMWKYQFPPVVLLVPPQPPMPTNAIWSTTSGGLCTAINRRRRRVLPGSAFRTRSLSIL